MHTFMTVTKITRTKLLALKRFLSVRETVPLCILLFFLAGCQSSADDGIVKVEEPNPVALVVTPLVEKTDVQAVYPGIIQAVREVDLGFPQAGRMLERSAEVGQRVNAHALLAKQDAEVFQRQQVAAGAGVMAQHAGLRVALRDANRAQQLLSEQFVSPAFFEKLKAQADVAQAGVAQAIAERAVLKKNVQDARLQAPFEGIVTATFAEAGQSLAAGQPVVRMADLTHLDIVFSVPEHDRMNWSVGKQVHWTPLAVSVPRLYTGKIREISPQADPITRSYGIKVAVTASTAENGNTQLPSLSLGSSVKVAQSVGAGLNQTRYRVPMGAVYQLRGEPIVWVVMSNYRVTPQKIRLVGYHPTGAIIEGKFPQPAVIIAVGSHLLQEGQRVRPEPWRQWNAVSELPASDPSLALTSASGR